MNGVRSAVTLRAFGRALRRARRAPEMSQQALGDAGGLGMKHVSAVERGEVDPRLTTLLRISAGLGISAGELLGLAEAEAEAEGEPDRTARNRGAASGA
jgi:transcriptional regulator with XRE-family HTH domain